MFRAAGCTNITPRDKEISNVSLKIINKYMRSITNIKSDIL